jgi:hypothetical protein
MSKVIESDAMSYKVSQDILCEIRAVPLTQPGQQTLLPLILDVFAR